MSRPDADHTAADRRAAAAVVEHHAQLAEALSAHTGRLRAAATGDDPGLVWRARDALLAWLRTELLPHAAAEEATLYPAAAAQPGGRLLVEGMLAEHQAITALVAELEAAGAPMDAAAAARALSALFAVHLAKENDLVLPLLVAADQVSLAGLLGGMHDLLGAPAVTAPAVTAPAVTAPAVTDGTPVANGGGCGGGGGCGCGGDTGRSGADAPVLTVDARLDVRDLPHHERHARVLVALEALPADGALVLIAPHAPRPLLAEIDARYRGQIDVQWLQDGPDVWRIRLHRQPATV